MSYMLDIIIPIRLKFRGVTAPLVFTTLQKPCTGSIFITWKLDNIIFYSWGPLNTIAMGSVHLYNINQFINQFIALRKTYIKLPFFCKPKTLLTSKNSKL